MYVYVSPCCAVNVNVAREQELSQPFCLGLTGVEFGQKLQDMHPRCLLQLKQYNSGYQRKVAKMFTRLQINEFLAMTVEGPEGFWLLNKAAAAIAFIGGLRIAELKSLKFKDLIENEDGIWVHYSPAKQRGEVKTAQFIIPFDPGNLATCYASHVKAYMQAVKKSLGYVDTNSNLFKTCLKGGRFSRSAMGINYLYKIPTQVATQLKLQNPSDYTGHSFCRSSATELANAGAASTDMC